MGSADVGRRAVLVGVAGAGAFGLVACSPGSSSTVGTDVPSGQPGDTLTPTADVDVGGGVVLSAAQVVVTQPTQGTFHCFSAICTHAGCLVAEVVDGEIVCTCHGSRFSATDGAVVQGPASAPLPEVPVTVEGSTVVRA